MAGNDLGRLLDLLDACPFCHTVLRITTLPVLRSSFYTSRLLRPTYLAPGLIFCSVSWWVSVAAGKVTWSGPGEGSYQILIGRGCDPAGLFPSAHSGKSICQISSQFTAPSVLTCPVERFDSVLQASGFCSLCGNPWLVWIGLDLDLNPWETFS